VCSGWVIYYGFRPKNGIKVERLEAELKARLPLGSTREQAEAWFAAHGFQPDQLGQNDQMTCLGARIANDSFFEDAVIGILLCFDAEGRLERRFIYRTVTGR
jgi:hypothetical protein